MARTVDVVVVDVDDDRTAGFNDVGVVGKGCGVGVLVVGCTATFFVADDDDDVLVTADVVKVDDGMGRN